MKMRVFSWFFCFQGTAIMKKILVLVAGLILTVWTGTTPAWAMHDDSSEQRIEDLSTRIDALEKSQSEKKELPDWLAIFSFSGLLEVEASYEKYNPDAAGEPSNDTSDITLSTMQFGVDAGFNKYVKGHVLFLWEQDETEPVDLDEGFITLSGANKTPPYLLAGKYYLPFGKFDTYFISDPGTTTLGEINETAVMGGCHGEILDVNAGAFNGDINKTGDEHHADNYVASITAALPDDRIENFTLTSGVSYISNIADTDGISDEIVDQDVDGESSDLQEYVPGLSCYASISFWEMVFANVQYVSALDDFKPGELSFGDDKLKPSAWNFEIAYISNISNFKIGAGLQYEGTDDCGDFIPETSYGGIIFWYPFEKTYLGLEYLNQNFENDDKDQKVTAQLAYEF
jgi:hypothetical protein